MANRRRAAPSDDGGDVLRVFVELWRSLFTSPIHLDSALAKLSPELRVELAGVVPELLRKPRALADRFGVTLREGEPWSRSKDELAAWGPARRLIEALRAAPSEEAIAELVATRADYPPRMIAELERAFGEARAAELARVLAEKPPIAVRAARKLGSESLAAELGNGASPSAVSPVGVVLARHSPLARHPWFAEGSFEIQDEGSQLLSLFALWPELVAPILREAPGAIDPRLAPKNLPPAPKSALTVIDACAGAGGKALAIADAIGGRGRVFAYDVSARKLDALKKRASRAHLTNVKTAAVEDGAELALVDRFRGSADVVLVDAPCSGWGVLRRNPDIKWRQGLDALARLPALQARLLRAYAGLVRPGGRLVYAVCTFRLEETREIVQAFEREHPELARGPGGYLGPGPSDGFFVQSFTRPV